MSGTGKLLASQYKWFSGVVVAWGELHINGIRLEAM